MSCRAEEMNPAGPILYTVVKNTFIDIEVPEDAESVLPAMRRLNSDSALVRLNPQCHSAEEDADLPKRTVSAGVFSGAGNGHGPTSVTHGAEHDRERSCSPDPEQRTLLDAGAKDRLSAWRKPSPSLPVVELVESSSTGKDMSSHSTCSSLNWAEQTDDELGVLAASKASSEADAEHAQANGTQMAFMWAPMCDVSAGNCFGEEAYAVYVPGSSSHCPPARPVPRLRGNHSEAVHRAFAEARAAADAHQYNLDMGVETVESLFCIPYVTAMVFYEQAEMAAEGEESNQAAESATQAGDDAEWYCHSCGLPKYDVGGNYCAYCGVKL